MMKKMRKIFITGTLCLLCLLFAGAAWANPNRFVTPTGAGSNDGSNWGNALSASAVSGFINGSLTDPTVYIHFAAGTYDIPVSIQGPSGGGNIQVRGGYPTGLTGTSTSGRDPAAHVTTLRVQNDYTPIFLFEGSRAATVDGVTIVGNDGGTVQRSAVEIRPSGNGTAKFTNVIFRDADVSKPSADTLGGAVLIEPANASAHATVEFENCRFIDNTVMAPSGYRAAGGAAAVNGRGKVDVTFTECSFSGNSAANSPGALTAGGAIFAETLTGGGAVNVTILSSRFADSSVMVGSGAAQGGALYLRQGAADKRLAVYIGGSVFDRNVAGNTAGSGEGGAVYAELNAGDGGYGNPNMGRFEVVASTFHNNSAPGGASKGGALRLNGVNGHPHMDVVGSTLTQNSAAEGSAVYANNGSSWAANIISGNTGAAFNFFGGTHSYGYNLVESANSSSLFDKTGDVTGVLSSQVFDTGALNADGTVSLLAGGLADGSVAGQGVPETTYSGFFGVISPASLKAYKQKDQTGATRPAPSGTNVDIGAYERDGTPPPPTPTVTPATSVSIVPASVVMDSGDTLPLVATVLPAVATNWVIVWQSTDDNIVTVSDNGVTATMTAVSPGSAQIIATVVNQDNSEVVASCVVSVSGDAPVPPDGVVPVTGITLPYASLTMEVGNAEMITATVLPTNATSKDVSWSVSPSGVAAITPNNAVLRDQTCTTTNPQVLAASSRNITITAIGAGTAILTAKTLDGGYTASCALVVTSGGSPAPGPNDAVVVTDPGVDDKLDRDGGDVSVSPGIGLPAITLPGYIIVDEIPDPNDVTVSPVDPTSLPVCTQALGYKGTELGVDVSGIAAGSDIVIMPVTATIPLNMARLQEVLDLAAVRTGQTLRIDDVIAAPQNYLEDLFTVLLIQQQIKEGPEANSYVWLVPGVIEPRAAYDYKLLLLSSVPGDGITLTLRYYVADDIKGARFVQGNLIVGDGLKNGRILDPIWSNVRAPAGTGGGTSRPVDGGSGCNAGNAAALTLLACAAFAARKKA